MADTDLLKYALTRDDYQLRQRVTAALMVEALYRVEAKPDQSVESLAMMNWILDNPLQPIDLMTAFAATMPEVAAKVTVDGGAVNTSEVLDADIKYVVGSKWNTVAAKRFATAA
jgi:hypothetical protein